MAELCPHRKPHIRRICNEKNSSGTITDIYIYLISILIRNESHFNPGHISVFVLFFFFLPSMCHAYKMNIRLLVLSKGYIFMG